MYGALQCPVESNDKAAHTSELCVRPRPCHLVVLSVTVEFFLKLGLVDETRDRLGKGPLRRYDVECHPSHLDKRAIEATHELLVKLCRGDLYRDVEV